MASKGREVPVTTRKAQRAEDFSDIFMYFYGAQQLLLN